MPLFQEDMRCKKLPFLTFFLSFRKQKTIGAKNQTLTVRSEVGGQFRLYERIYNRPALPDHKLFITDKPFTGNKARLAGKVKLSEVFSKWIILKNTKTHGRQGLLSVSGERHRKQLPKKAGLISWAANNLLAIRWIAGQSATALTLFDDKAMKFDDKAGASKDDCRPPFSASKMVNWKTLRSEEENRAWIRRKHVHLEIPYPQVLRQIPPGKDRCQLWTGQSEGPSGESTRWISNHNGVLRNTMSSKMASRRGRDSVTVVLWSLAVITKKYNQANECADLLLFKLKYMSVVSAPGKIHNPLKITKPVKQVFKLNSACSGPRPLRPKCCSINHLRVSVISTWSYATKISTLDNNFLCIMKRSSAQTHRRTALSTVCFPVRSHDHVMGPNATIGHTSNISPWKIGLACCSPRESQSTGVADSWQEQSQLRATPEHAIVRRKKD